VLEVLSEDNGGAEHKAILVQEDDSIIVAGRANDADDYRVLALYKYLPDGSRDITFGIDGASYADHICQGTQCNPEFPRGGENPHDIMLQSDGKIIVARTESVHYDYDAYFGVARFNADGSLDTSYGSYGGYGIAIEGWAEAGAIQSDDKALVAGAGWQNQKRGIAVSRFNADGTVDTGFANQGTFYSNTSPDNYSEYGHDVAVQADGKILIAGDTYVKGCGDDNSTNFMRGALIRLNADGSLDTSFDGDGIVKFNASAIFDVYPWDLSETHPCQDNYFKSVKVQPDGKIIVMGKGSNAAFRLFIARFNPNGSLDKSFGYQGVRAVYTNYDYTSFDHLNTHFTYVWGRKLFSIENMMLGKNGNIVVSGQITYDDDYQNYGFLAMHFTSNGSFDARYGSIGDARVDVNFPGDTLTGGATAFALAEQKSGKVLLAGFADGYDAPSTAVLTRTVKAPNNIAPIINFLLD
jgi:uncharacterized delta-60 repeat protein